MPGSVLLPAVVLVVLVLPASGLGEGTWGSVMLPSGCGLGEGAVPSSAVLFVVLLAGRGEGEGWGFGDGLGEAGSGDESVVLPEVVLVVVTAGWGLGEGDGLGDGEGLLTGAAAGDGEAGVGDGDICCATRVSTGTLNVSDPAFSHTIESYVPLPPSPMATLKLYLVLATTRTVVVLSSVVTPSNSVLRGLPTLLR